MRQVNLNLSLRICGWSCWVKLKPGLTRYEYFCTITYVNYCFYSKSTRWELQQELEFLKQNQPRPLFHSSHQQQRTNPHLKNHARRMLMHLHRFTTHVIWHFAEWMHAKTSFEYYKGWQDKCLIVLKLKKSTLFNTLVWCIFVASLFFYYKIRSTKYE